MEAGRELNAEVAIKVMGYRLATEAEPYWNSLAVWIAPDGERWEGIPHYSTDIAAAWQVVEKLNLSVMRDDGGGWAAAVLYGVPYIEEDWGRGGYIDCGLHDGAYADTAPLAICRAALAAADH